MNYFPAEFECTMLMFNVALVEEKLTIKQNIKAKPCNFFFWQPESNNADNVCQGKPF